MLFEKVHIVNKVSNLSQHIILYYGLKIFVGILSLATIILFVKVAGQKTYGEYSLIISIILTLNTAFSGWLNQILLKYFSTNKENTTLIQFLKVFIPISLSIGLLLSIFIFQNQNTNQSTFVLSSIFIATFIYSIIGAIFQKSFKLKKFFLLESVRVVLLLTIPLIIYYFMQMPLTIENLLITVLLSFLLPSLTQIKSIFKDFTNLKEKKKNILFSKYKKKIYYIYIHYGIPIGLWFAVASALNLVDRYLISYYFSFEEVGIYSAVYDITYKICAFALAPILTAVHPLIMEAYQQKTDTIQDLIKKTLLLELKISPFLFLIIIGLSYFSNTLLNISSQIFLYLALPVLLGSILWNISMILHKTLELRNQTLIMLQYIAIAFLVNLISNIILIPYFGYIAAAYTTILGFSVYLLLISRKVLSYQKSTLSAI